MKTVRPDGAKIQKFRESLGWTQDLLAEKSGYSTRTVRKSEAGELLSIRTAIDIAMALDVELSEVISRSDLESLVAKNRLLVESALESLAKNNIGDFLSCLSDDIDIHLSGPAGSIYVGDFEGKASLRDLILKSWQANNLNLACNVTEWILNGSHVIVFGSLYLDGGKGDGVLLNQWCLSIRIQDALICNVRHYSTSCSLAF